MKIDTFFSDGEKKRINQAIADAEKKTSAEIVPVLTDASGDYDRAEDLCGLVVAVVAVAVCWLLFQGVTHSRDWASGQNPALAYNLVFVLLTFVVGFVVGVIAASKIWIVRNVFTPRSFMAQCVERGAKRAFHEFSLSKTKGATGVLIYISHFEGIVYVLGDDAISEKLTNRDFESVRDAILTGFKSGKKTDGLCDGIRLCGEKLAEHFPIEADDTDELPNELRIFQQSL